ncbi:hypothetical protein J2Z33_000036 [Rubellimicrobium aerolatum]|nr:hypothetical protein [Rubellimicrobium aerolatum]
MAPAGPGPPPVPRPAADPRQRDGPMTRKKGGNPGGGRRLVTVGAGPGRRRGRPFRSSERQGREEDGPSRYRHQVSANAASAQSTRRKTSHVHRAWLASAPRTGRSRDPVRRVPRRHPRLPSSGAGIPDAGPADTKGGPVQACGVADRLPRRRDGWSAPPEHDPRAGRTAPAPRPADAGQGGRAARLRNRPGASPQLSARGIAALQKYGLWRHNPNVSVRQSLDSNSIRNRPCPAP